MRRYSFLLAGVLVWPAAAQTSRRAEVEWRWGVERQPAVRSADAEASQYVAALGTRLSYAVPEPTTFRFRFVLYDDSVGLEVPGFGVLTGTHQVYALPGGIVIVPMSLFAATADEAEFAAALARGIGHVALRHWLRTAARNSLVSPWQPAPKSLLFTRSFEGEADRAAVAILARTGLNPQALMRYAGNDRASVDTSDIRLRAIMQAISELPPLTYGPDDSAQFRAIKSRLAKSVLRV